MSNQNNAATIVKTVIYNGFRAGKMKQAGWKIVLNDGSVFGTYATKAAAKAEAKDFGIEITN